MEDVPGVTRDRVAYDASWAGRDFTVVDTGGWVSDARGRAARVAAQAELAVAAADVVVFVVDGTVGATDADEAVIGVLRRARAQVVLAVNKVDGQSGEPDAAELWSFGLGMPYPVSALHGRGSGDLLDADRRGDARRAPPSGPRRPGRTASRCSGKPNVGKSSLLNRVVGAERSVVDSVAGTTVDPVDELVELGGETWRFIDTAGIRARSRPRPARSTTRASVRTPHSSGARSPSSSSTPASRSPSRTSGSSPTSSTPVAGWSWRSTSGTSSTRTVDPMLEREIERDLDRVAWAPRVNVSAKTGWHTDRLVPGAADRAGRLGAAHPDRPAELVHGRGRGRHPAAGTRWQAAQDPLRDAGVDPPADVRPLHQRVPGGRLPPLRGPPAARGVRLRRNAHPPRRPRPGTPQPLRAPRGLG